MKPAVTTMIFLTEMLLVLLPAGEAQTQKALSVPTPYEYRSSERPGMQRVTDSEAGMKETVRCVYLMGTLCTIQLYSPDSQMALKQIESFIRQLEKAEEELSTWKKDSILSRLNRQPVGVPFEISESIR